MASTLIIGSTGLVGAHILSTLLASDAPSVVHTISRRLPKSTGPKLQATVEADTTQWASQLSAISPPPTTVISSLGTTRAQAGGIANQWKIDHDLNVELARSAKQAGVRNFVFISSAGIRSFLSGYVPYSQMKRGVEDAVKELGFETAVIVRPGLIMGEREVPHQGGPLVNSAVRGLGRLLGQGAADKFGQEAEVIARAAVHAARIAEEGKAPEKYWVLEAADIVRLGRTEWKS
ncbi:Protein FMP52, mitochondrial [Madurella mycetomatis]|uniref:Protein FMP52, mitochondrial n=1 Tax=Madurella mycetomatis TaxID=100816 RepID=A0A175W0S2_9PEZI|nr:Protein FMP52, mitochondrial [Madurella mycetomatis]